MGCLDDLDARSIAAQQGTLITITAWFFACTGQLTILVDQRLPRREREEEDVLRDRLGLGVATQRHLVVAIEVVVLHQRRGEQALELEVRHEGLDADGLQIGRG